MKDYIKIFYDNGLLNKNKIKSNWIEKNIPELYLELREYEKTISIDLEKFSQLLWHYQYRMTSYPKCEYCLGENKRFNGFETGYKLGCDKHCAIRLTRPKSNETRRLNTLSKHGVEHTTQLKSTQDKMKRTNLERYGFEHSTKNDLIKKKIKDTNLLKWGVEIPLQNDSIKSSMIEGFLKKWGVDNPSKSTYVKNLRKENNLEKWGVEWSITHPYIKDKIKAKNDLNFYDRIKEIHKDSDKVNLLSCYDGIVKFHCKKCQNDFEINTNLLHQRFFKNEIDICLICNPIDSKTSNGHNEIIDFLNNIGVKNILSNDRNIISPNEIDIYLPDYNLGIEFNGVYWHSELHKDKKYHINKRLKCVEQKIDLIQVWEDDWKYKTDIIKSIIANRLKKNYNNIGARKCQIREVGIKEAKAFLDKNHIQGWAVSKWRLGLYYNDELVSLATFSKGRKNMGSNSDEYELVRFCNKINFNIMGSLSRLFNRFLKLENPNKIISYCDLDLFKGDSYIKLGMILTSHSMNYHWCDGKIRWNRWSFRKDKLVSAGFDKKMSEYEIMISRGWYRCWGSGNNKYSIKICN